MQSGIHSIKRLSKGWLHNFSYSKKNKRVIKKFADKNGLIYFGSVDQKYDEHRIVHGFTVSATHKDNHYSVGTFEEYDVTIIDRNDAILRPGRNVSMYSWVVLAINLQAKKDLPHFFINSNNHDQENFEPYFESNINDKKIDFDPSEGHSEEFSNRFSAYCTPGDAYKVKKLINRDFSRTIAAHFWPLSAEIEDGVLYIYSNDKKISMMTLNNMLSCGIWMAKNIDSQSESI